MSGQPSGGKPRITHIALKVEDADQAAKVFKEVFGFTETDRRRSDEDNHLSVHLTDGIVDLAFLSFDSSFDLSADNSMAAAAGENLCIHHFGIDVEQPDQFMAELENAGAEFLKKPAGPNSPTMMFRVPGGGGITELAPHGWHERKKGNA